MKALKAFVPCIVLALTPSLLVADEQPATKQEPAPAAQAKTAETGEAKPRQRTVIAPKYYQPPPMPLPRYPRFTADQGVGMTMYYYREELTSTEE